MLKRKSVSTYWECKHCRCSWSGKIDIKEMQDHYREEHPEIDQTYLVDEEDYMQKKVSISLNKRNVKRKT